METLTKKCTKCGEVKDLNNFYLKKRGKYGRTGSCKVCEADKNRKYWQANKDKLSDKSKKYYQENKEQHKEVTKKWRAYNKEKVSYFHTKYNKKQAKKMSFRYIKNLLKAQSIPLSCETVEAKRNIIKIHREIKKLQNETNK